MSQSKSAMACEEMTIGGVETWLCTRNALRIDTPCSAMHSLCKSHVAAGAPGGACRR